MRPLLLRRWWRIKPQSPPGDEGKDGIIILMNRGFTIFEVAVAIGLIVIMAGTVLYFINPVTQLRKSRDVRREADIRVIINAISTRMADNRGVFSCSAGVVPASSTRIAIGAGNYDLAPCLVSTYLSSMPYDPSHASANFNSTTSYNTAYAIFRSATTGRITVHAIYPEISEYIWAIR